MQGLSRLQGGRGTNSPIQQQQAAASVFSNAAALRISFVAGDGQSRHRLRCQSQLSVFFLSGRASHFLLTSVASLSIVEATARAIVSAIKVCHDLRPDNLGLGQLLWCFSESSAMESSLQLRRR